MSDELKLTNFSRSENLSVGCTENLEKDNRFTVSKLIYGTRILRARHIGLLLFVLLLTVVCISVVTTVVTAHIIRIASKDTEGPNDNNSTISRYNSQISTVTQKYKTIKESPDASRGEKGLIGEKGMPGDKGARGSKGLKGDRGALGEKGRQGQDSVEGLKGETGIIGHKGKIGEKGSKGQKGERGLIGDNGLSGRKGEDGIDGTNGQKGLTGDKGPTGNKGPVGDKGKAGNKGFPGDKGEPGSKGLVGDKGQSGDKGLEGEKGSVGDKGAKGVKGSSGQKGEKGDRDESVVGRSCDTGWMPYGQYCYYFVYKKKTWQNAQEDCEKRNSSLVKIENASENWFLKSFSKEEGLGEVWIGANDLEKDGHMEWVSDKTPVSGGFSNWVPSEPNNNGGHEHCVHLWPSRSYKWNDTICGNTNVYICKI